MCKINFRQKMNLLGRNRLKKRRTSRRKKQPARGTAFSIPCPEVLQFCVLICQEKLLNRTLMTNIQKVKVCVCNYLISANQNSVSLILSSWISIWCISTSACRPSSSKRDEKCDQKDDSKKTEDRDEKERKEKDDQKSASSDQPKSSKSGNMAVLHFTVSLHRIIES